MDKKETVKLNNNNAVDTELNIKQEDGSFLTVHPVTKESNIIPEEGKRSLRDCKFDDVVSYFDQEKEINVMEFYANQNKVKSVEFMGGSGRPKPGTITSTIEDRFSIREGEAIVIPFVFDTPNRGEATLYVSIICGEKTKELEYPVKRIGAGSVNIGTLDKGVNNITFYIVDTLGQMTNTLTTTVICGSIEIKSSFDDNQDFNSYASISIPLNLSSLDKTSTMVLTANIDGVDYTQQVTEGYNSFNFPAEKKTVGVHHVIMQVASEDFISNILEYNIIIVDNTQILISAKNTSLTIEEGNDVAIPYRISTIGQNMFNVVISVNGELYKEVEGVLGNNVFNGLYSDFPKGVYTIRITAKSIDGTMEGHVDIALNVIENSFKRIEFVKPGLQAWFNMARKSNMDPDRDVLDSEVLTDIGKRARLRLHDYNYSTNGWINGKLVNNGISWAEIENYLPLEDNAPNGFTFEIQFNSFNAGEDSARVIDCLDGNTGYGFFIDSEKAGFKSESNELKTFYTDRTDMRISFVVNRTSTYIDKNGIRQPNPMLQTFINGLFTEVAMLSDSGVGGNKILENVTSTSPLLINTDALKEIFGSNEIKTILIYNRPLEHEEILQNLMADIDNLAEQKKIYDKNYVTINQDLPTMYFNDTEIGNHDTMTKDTKQWINVVYVSPDKEKYGPSFDLICQTAWQGTSSLQYPIKNYKFKTYDYNRDENGEIIKEDQNNPKTFKKVKLDMYSGRDGDGYAESTFCLKCDYMDSSHCRNTGTARLVNDFLFNGHPNPAKQVDPKTRDTINGFPIQLYVNGEWYGLYNFNHDKSCTRSLGLETKPNTVRWEIKANSDTSEGAFFKTWDSTDVMDIYKKILSDFEIVFDEDAFGSWDIVDGELILEDDATGEYDVTKYYDELGIPHDGNVIGNYRDYSILSLARFINFVSETKDKEEYRRRASEYFDIEQACRYYLNVMTLGMIDNFAKNCIINMYGDDIWWFNFYDMDSSLGLDNTGYNKFETDIEPSQPNIYNCSTSQMWVKLNNWLQTDIFNTFKKIREDRYTFENIVEYLIGSQIDIIPQIAYNRDSYAKYISQGRQYLHMLHGNNKDHLLRWLYNRFQYVDSLFLQQNSPYTKKSITVRSNKPLWVPEDQRYKARFEIETYCPQYVTIAWRKNTYETKRIGFNETVVFETEMVNSNDNEIIVYCAGNLKRIGDCTNLRPTSIDIGFADRLVEFKCENSDVLLKADLSKNTYLKEVSFKGCSQMGNTTGGANVLDVSKCTNLRKIDVRGTQITSIFSNVDGGNLEEVLYSDVTQSVVLSRQTNLKLIGLPYGYENLWSGVKNVVIEKGYNIYYDEQSKRFIKTDHPMYYTVVKREDLNNGELTTDNLWEIEPGNIDVILPTHGTTMHMYFFNENKEYTGKNSIIDSEQHTELQVSTITPPKGSVYCMLTVMFERPMDSRINEFGVVKSGNRVFKTLKDLTNVQISNCGNVDKLDIYSGFADNNNIFKALSNTQNITLDNSLGMTDMNFEGFKKLRNLTIKNMLELRSIGFDDMLNTTDNATLYSMTFVNCPLIKTISMNVTSDDASVRFAENARMDISGLTSVETITSNYSIKGLKDIILPPQLKNVIFTDEFGDGDNSIKNIWCVEAIPDHLIDDFTGIDFKGMDIDIIDLIGLSSITNGLNFNITPIEKHPNLNTKRDGSVMRPWFRPEGTVNLTDYIGPMEGMFKGVNANNLDIIINNPSMHQDNLSGVFENAIVDDVTVVNKVLSKFPDATNLDSMLMNVVPINTVKGIRLPSKAFTMKRAFLGCVDLSEDIALPSNVVNIDEAFKNCVGITNVVSNWDNSYDNNITFKNCYMNCVNINTIDETPGTLNDVPRDWGGYGFDKDVTMLAEISTYAAKTRTITICNDEAETVHLYTDWGDGTINDKFQHTYVRDGVYSIKTQKLSTLGYQFAKSFKDSLIKVTQMPSSLIAYESLFAKCENLTYAEFVINNDTPSLSGLFDGCHSLEYAHINLPDNCFVLSNLFKGCGLLQDVSYMADWDMSHVNTMRDMLNGCKSLTALDVSKWDMSNVTTIRSIFQDCVGITTLNVFNWIVDNVTSMAYAFAGCRALVDVDVSNWNTGNCTEFQNVFQNCTAMTEFKVSGWNVSKGKNFGFMFQSCENLRTLDLSTWNMANATSIISLVQNCVNLTNINVSTWSLPKCTTISYVFNGCRSLLSLDLSHWDIRVVVSAVSTFSSCVKLRSVILGDWSVNKLQNISGLFQGCVQLESITNLEKLNTRYVVNISSVFQSCESITELLVSDWVVDNVTTMSNLFSSCTNLVTLDLSNWDVSRVIDMTYMFYECQGLTMLNITGWQTDNLQRMYSIFQGCSKLMEINVANWDVTGVVDLNCVFQNCTSLLSLDLTRWNVMNVVEFGSLFQNCISLKTLNVTGWKTNNVRNLSYAFYNCKNLTELDLSSWDLDAADDVSSLYFTFISCDLLGRLISPKNINSSVTIPNQTNKDTLVGILNNLKDRTSASSLKLTLGATNLAKLSPSDILIATNKNWSVA